jgi:hypothetical protein
LALANSPWKPVAFLQAVGPDAAVNNVIHFAGLDDINFSGQGELDPLAGPNMIQADIINALNYSGRFLERNMLTQLRSLLKQLFKVLAPLCALTGLVLAQPSLKIVTPADGTTVHPGESLTVQVDVSPPGVFDTVSVSGSIPIGNRGTVLNAPPYRFTIQIRGGITPTKYFLAALGITLSKELVYSDPIDILVERADSPLSISVYPTVADFTMDQKRYLQVTGLYADKTTADLTQSSRIKYVSSAPGIATVQAQGVVTPVTPGSAKITITYGDLKIEVPVLVRGIAR